MKVSVDEKGEYGCFALSLDISIVISFWIATAGGNHDILYVARTSIAIYSDHFVWCGDLAGMLYCARRQWLFGAFCFMVAVTARSNGIFLSGFILYGLIGEPMFEHRKVRLHHAFLPQTFTLKVFVHRSTLGGRFSQSRSLQWSCRRSYTFNTVHIASSAWEIRSRHRGATPFRRRSTPTSNRNTGTSASYDTGRRSSFRTSSSAPHRSPSSSRIHSTTCAAPSFRASKLSCPRPRPLPKPHWTNRRSRTTAPARCERRGPLLLPRPSFTRRSPRMRSTRSSWPSCFSLHRTRRSSCASPRRCRAYIGRPRGSWLSGLHWAGGGSAGALCGARSAVCCGLRFCLRHECPMGVAVPELS